MRNSTKVLDKGFIELVDHCGDDLKVVNSARVSHGQHHDKLEKGDKELINFLMKHRHGTPFEQIDFTFKIKCPISVAREWMRHRVASFNEISARYVKMEPEFYNPDHKNIREQKGKPGHYEFVMIEDESVRRNGLKSMRKLYEDAYRCYNELLELGWAKELARQVLPLGLYTQFYFKINGRSLMNFISLRNEKNAMYEIREYAKVLEQNFRHIAPLTHDAFIANGRQAP